MKQTVLMLTTTKEKKKNILKSKVKIKVRPPDFGLLTCLMKKSPWIKDTRPKLVYLNTWSISHIIFRTTCKKEKINNHLNKKQKKKLNKQSLREQHKLMLPL